MKINIYPFDKTTPVRLQNEQYGSDWPIVYIINNDKEAYVGETVDASVRTAQHLENPERRKLKQISIIGDDKFNKSVILDLESFLIRYMSSDKKFKLQNGNMGIRSHSYYDKARYEESFQNVWGQLKNAGLTKNTIQEIENTDLFKYSPYKSLSKDQYEVVHNLLKNLVDALDAGKEMTAFVHGGPGTGKTILAVYMMRLLKGRFHNGTIEEDELDAMDEGLYKSLKRLSKYDLKIGLVIPVNSFCRTMKRIFKETSGLSNNMVYTTTEVSKEKFDLLIVDEAHRLKQKKAIMQYKTFSDANKRLGFDADKGTELDWILKQSRHRIFFYDEGQSIRPSDIDSSIFKNLEQRTGTVSYCLESQLRCKGGMDYINYVHNILKDNSTEKPKKIFDYEFVLFDSPNEMIDAIYEREKEFGLCRVTAGYSWKWKSQRRSKHVHLDGVYDVEFGDRKYIWNSTDTDWVYKKDSIKEIGCVHTTQGYDLNYNGVLFGKEIDYDFSTKSFVIDKKKYFDANGKREVRSDEVLKEYILNIYSILLTRGIRGTYMCAMNPNMQKYLSMFANNVKPLI